MLFVSHWFRVFGKQVLGEFSCVRNISQMPVVLIPIHFDRDPANRIPSCARSIVIRPFLTSDFMTGVPILPGSDKLPELVSNSHAQTHALTTIASWSVISNRLFTSLTSRLSKKWSETSAPSTAYPGSSTIWPQNHPARPNGNNNLLLKQNEKKIYIIHNEIKKKLSYLIILMRKKKQLRLFIFSKRFQIPHPGMKIILLHNYIVFFFLFFIIPRSSYNIYTLFFKLFILISNLS